MEKALDMRCRKAPSSVSGSRTCAEWYIAQPTGSRDAAAVRRMRRLEMMTLAELNNRIYLTVRVTAPLVTISKGYR